MYACIHVPDFATQSASRLRPELRRSPVAVLDGEAPLETVFATNTPARRLGVARGMSKLQALSFSGLHLLHRLRAQEQAAQDALLGCASTYSPRIENVLFQHAPEPGGTLVLDIDGTRGLFGDAATLATKLRNQAATHGLRSHVAVSANFDAAVCAARALPGVTVLPERKEGSILGPLPCAVLDLSPEIAETLALWGIHTCAQLAALPERDLIARTGAEGQRLRQLARGEHRHLLVPIEASFDSELVEAMELDHPLDLLEPLLFLFARMIDQLMTRVRSRALAIARIDVQLKHTPDAGGQPHSSQRTIRPALPCEDTRRLLKLIQLDFEAHPPGAAILAIEMRAVAGKPQTAQQGLFLPQSPEPGRLDILLARLRKLFGDDRVGAPRLVDTHRANGFRLETFRPSVATDTPSMQSESGWPTVFRVCRPPRAIRVIVVDHKLRTVMLDGERFSVQTQAGPWRRDGEWWSQHNWCREEWDVVLAAEPQQAVKVCRIALDPSARCWYLEGTYD